VSSYTSEKELLNRLSGLPREISPGNDPWEKIAARLDDRQAALAGEPARRGGRAWPMMAVAASAVLALAIVLLQVQQGTVPDLPAVSSSAGPDTIADPMPAVRAGSEAEYLAAFREFVTVGDSRERIPAQTVEQIETGWAELQQVETALEDALALNPEDPFLNKRMLDLRAKQLGFLRQLAALDHSNRRLTI
jgi:hypothetical protein